MFSAGRSPRHVARRPWTWWSGITLVASGLALIGYVGWQLVGTTWVANRTQAEVTRSLERAWSDGRDQTDVDAGPSRAILRIPRFGDDWAVPVIEGTDDTALAAGVGHFPRSAAVGEVGNFALAGHRITHGEPFSELLELRAGDLVLVDTRDTTYTYELVTDGNALVVPFTDGWVLDPLPRNVTPGGAQPPQDPGERLITLTTCSELFHTDDRSVVFGRLVDTAPR